MSCDGDGDDDDATAIEASGVVDWVCVWIIIIIMKAGGWPIFFFFQLS